MALPHGTIRHLRLRSGSASGRARNMVRILVPLARGEGQQTRTLLKVPERKTDATMTAIAIVIAIDRMMANDWTMVK